MPTARSARGSRASRCGSRSAGRRSASRCVWLDPTTTAAEGPGVTSSIGAVDAVDPAHSVLRSERDAQLRAAVAALDEPYREVVALRFFAERSLAEIAVATDRPLGTVKTHLHRGLARLRQSLEAADR